MEFVALEDNICQSIWDKIEVLLETLWGTCQELGTLCFEPPLYLASLDGRFPNHIS